MTCLENRAHEPTDERWHFTVGHDVPKLQKFGPEEGDVAADPEQPPEGEHDETVDREERTMTAERVCRLVDGSKKY